MGHCRMRGDCDGSTLASNRNLACMNRTRGIVLRSTLRLLFVAWNMGEWHQFARLSAFSTEYKAKLIGTFLLTWSSI